MQDDLRQIFDTLYEPTSGLHRMSDSESAVWERAAEVLGWDGIDALIDSETPSMIENEYEYFRRGFCLGVRMMLAVLL